MSSQNFVSHVYHMYISHIQTFKINGTCRQTQLDYNLCCNAHTYIKDFDETFYVI